MASNRCLHADGRHGACPRGATTDGPADNRRSAGTSPVAAMTSRCNSFWLPVTSPRGQAPWCRLCCRIAQRQL